MIDKLIYADEFKAETSFTITDANPLCINGVFQEGGLLENMAQTAAAHAKYLAGLNNGPVKKGFIGSVNNFEIARLPKKGDTLITNINIIDQIFAVTVISAKVFCDGEQIASAELKIFIQD